MDLRAFALRPRCHPSAARVQCNTQHVVRVLREEALRVRLGVKHNAKPRSVVHQLASRRAEKVVAAVMAAVAEVAHLLTRMTSCCWQQKNPQSVLTHAHTPALTQPEAAFRQHPLPAYPGLPVS